MTAAAPPAALRYEGRDLEALFNLENYQRWIVDEFAAYLGGDTVEFGAGIGAVARHLLARVGRLTLVEPSANLAEPLSARFAHEPKVAVVAETIERYLASAPPASQDTAVLVNLLEHLDDDRAVLADIRELLRPGGHLLVFVPALPFLYSRLDAIVGHRRRYTRAALAGAVSAAGFGVLKLRYFDMLGVLPWWLVNTLGGSRRFDPRLAALYDRFGVPLTRAFERALPPPFGKNLLLVARRDPAA